MFMDWRDGSVGNVLAEQKQRPERKAPEPMESQAQ